MQPKSAYILFGALPWSGLVVGSYSQLIHAKAEEYWETTIYEG
ncbi:MAG: hypothetical protein PHQ23_09835 [Candidatus Wallbacteria bacterium]|nr:hypothetical protein [Candidatus Wallbacteria bacterium]